MRSMLSPSTVVVRCIRIWDRMWPFALGRYFPWRFIKRGLDSGWLHPVWFQFRPGLWMKLDFRDEIQREILFRRVWDPQITAMVTTHLSAGMVFFAEPMERLSARAHCTT